MKVRIDPNVHRIETLLQSIRAIMSELGYPLDNYSDSDMIKAALDLKHIRLEEAAKVA